MIYLYMSLLFPAKSYPGEGGALKIAMSDMFY